MFQSVSNFAPRKLLFKVFFCRKNYDEHPTLPIFHGVFVKTSKVVLANRARRLSQQALLGVTALDQGGYIIFAIADFR